jgi:hypothetical protein
VKRECAFFLSAALLSQVANAQVAADEISALCKPGQAANAKPSMSPIDILNYGLAKSAMRPGIFDPDRDGTDLARHRIWAVVDPVGFCAAFPGHCQSGDVDALAAVGAKLRNIFSIGTISVVRKNDVAGESLYSGLDLAERPYLCEPNGPAGSPKRCKRSESGSPSLGEALDERGAFAVISCTLPDIAPAPATKVANAGPTQGGFRLTGKREGLTQSRTGAKALEAIEAAKISLSNDAANDKQSFSTAFFIGYDFSTNAATSIVPFASFTRERIRTPIATEKARLAAIARGETPIDPAAKDKMTLQFGGVYGFSVNNNRFDVAPSLLSDLERDSLTTNLAIDWIPSLLVSSKSPFYYAVPAGPGAIRIQPFVLFRYAHVFDSGSNTELLDVSNYFRTGGGLRSNIWLARTGLLSGLRFDVNYRYLFRIAGGGTDVSLFTTTAAYTIPGTKNVELSVTRERGKDENTLDPIQLLKLNLGIRF